MTYGGSLSVGHFENFKREFTTPAGVTTLPAFYNFIHRSSLLTRRFSNRMLILQVDHIYVDPDWNFVYLCANVMRKEIESRGGDLIQSDASFVGVSPFKR